jgi:beta-carotene hydroxylase
VHNVTRGSSLRPRFREDYRALFWAFVVFPIAPIASIAAPRFSIWLFPLALYSAYSAGVLCHNHNHARVFENHAANAIYSSWLSVFYGFPIFAWIPTHNQNHHRYLNGEGDATRTTFVVGKTLFSALEYSVRAGAWQAPFIRGYLSSLYRRSPLRLAVPLLQVAMILIVHGAVLWWSISRHPGFSGVLVYAASLGVPALLAPALLQLTNYWQHLDCDPKSPDDHSRNFVNPVFNWFVFDNGYHTVHHENPGTHWSRYRALHDSRASRIAPRLRQQTPFDYVFREYFLRAARPGSAPQPSAKDGVLPVRR